MQRVRRRWPLIGAVTLLVALGGAAWAALATPVYRATATVIDPRSEIPAGQNLPAEFEVHATAAHGNDLVRSATIGIDRSGVAVDVNADSGQAETAHLLAQTYADLIVNRYERVEPRNAARFPLTPHSPHLMRTAVVTSLAGLAAGLLLARLVEAFSPTKPRVSTRSELATMPIATPGAKGWLGRSVCDTQRQTAVATSPAPGPTSPEGWRAPRIELPRQPSALAPVTLRQPGFTPRVVVLPAKQPQPR